MQPQLDTPRSVRTSRQPSWAYPLKGMYYFASRRFLHTLLISRLLPLALLSIFVLSILFTFTYLPQVLFLFIFHGRLAWFNATVLVLGEGQVIIALLFEAFLVDEQLVDVFDAVLIAEGYEDLVGQQRSIHSVEEGGNPRQRLGPPTSNAIYSPFSLRQVVEFIVFLPFNLIPVIGVPIFLLLTGYRAGPLHHYRYFKLLALDRKQRKKEIKNRGLRYTWFGTMAMILQLIPGLSMLFLLTTAAGSALWACEMEKERRGRAVMIVQEDETPREPPPEYTDDPI